MRTTITLEPDVQALLRAAMKERGISFKEALNSAVRAGLTQGKARGGHYVQRSYSLGGEQNFRWDKALAVAAALEDEELGRRRAAFGYSAGTHDTASANDAGSDGAVGYRREPHV